MFTVNSTNSVEQKYIKNINPKRIIAFFAKKMLIKSFSKILITYKQGS